MPRKRILDICCGSRMCWFDKNNQSAIYNDIRDINEELCDGRLLKIQPDTHYDFRHVDFEDGYFNIVLFDPPHLLHAGKKSWLSMKYGIFI